MQLSSVHPLQHQLSRRAVFAVGAVATPIVVPSRALAEEKPLTSAAVILQVAENTAAMQQILMKSASDMDELTVQERSEKGRPPIGRSELKASVDLLLRNSKLATIPNAREAADTLRGVKAIADTGNGSLQRDELTAMAKQYARAGEELQKVFEAMPAEEQAEGKAITRELRAARNERVRAIREEEEKVRIARARIAEENANRQAAGQEPPRKKTLAELEAAQATFNKQQQPVLSLYAR